MAGYLKQIPNILTVFRIVLVPVMVMSFFGAGSDGRMDALIIFMIAGVTDVVDGILARRFNWITKFGTVMDPLADKLMQSAAFICLAIVGDLPLWALAIFLGKEILMVYGGIVAYFRHEKMVVKANVFGKAATVSVSITMVLLFLMPDHQIAFISLITSIIFKLVALSTYILNWRRNIA